MSQIFTAVGLVNPVPPSQGGTGLVSFVAGDLLYASAADTLGRLAKGTNGQVLTMVAGLPAWAAAAAASPLTTKGDLYGFSTVDARLPVGADDQVLTADSSEALGVKWAAAASGSGDVSAAANLTDNAIVRGDGGAKGVQDSSVLIDDSDNITGATSLAVGNLNLASNTLSSTDTNGDVILSPDGTGGIVAVTDLTVGNTTQDVNFTINGASIAGTVSVEGTNATDLGGIISHRHSDTAGFGGHFVNLRSRGTHASPTVVSDGDTLSIMASAGYDGTDYAQASQIVTQVDGTPGANDMPGRIMFLTSADGGQTPTEAMRIDSSQKVGIGITAPLDTLHVVGNMELDHTAAENDDHAFEIVCDANNFADVKALDIDYITGNLAAAEDEEAIIVNIDETASTGGIMAGYLVLTTTEGSATINGYETGVGVNPIVHESGTFGDADNILNKAVDVTAALASGGAGNISIFVADNDTITIGDAATWGEMEIILDTGASGSGVAPTFEYSTGGAAFSSFVPADGTNGFRNTGAILWDASSLTGWATATSGRYEIKITRTRNSLTTTPIIDELQIAALTEYKWDKDGAVNLNSLSLTTALTETNGGTNQTSYTTGDILYSDATDSLSKLSAAQCPNILIMDDTGVPSWSDDISYFYEDFIYQSSTGTDNYPWSRTLNGTGTSTQTKVGIAGHPGIWELATGTTNAGRAAIQRGSNNTSPLIIGNGVVIVDFIIHIPVLSTASEEFVCGFGVTDFYNVFGGSPITNDQVTLVYDRTQSTNWLALTRSGGTETVASGGSSVAVDTNWTHARIVINADATSVEFFIDGTSLGTSTTNIPSSDLGIGAMIDKDVGTTERTLEIDCIRFYNKLTTSRFSS